MTLAPRNAGTIRACHRRKLLLVSSWVGRLPKATARAELDDEELMTANRSVAAERRLGFRDFVWWDMARVLGGDYRCGGGGFDSSGGGGLLGCRCGGGGFDSGGGDRCLVCVGFRLSWSWLFCGGDREDLCGDGDVCCGAIQRQRRRRQLGHGRRCSDTMSKTMTGTVLESIRVSCYI